MSLKSMTYKIIPSILSADKNYIAKKLQELRGLVDEVHIDIADGKFVPNALIRVSDLLGMEELKDFDIELHLMVENPGQYFKECEQLGVKRVIVHAEAVGENIKEEFLPYHFEKGIAINPETPLTALEPYHGTMNMVTILGVHPGFQGQKFIPETLKKIRQARKEYPTMKIEADGGVNLSTIKDAAHAGADFLVVGSELMQAEHMEEKLK